MNSPQPAPSPAALSSRAQGRSWTRRLVNAGVALVVIAVAGATFVFSYPGVHAIALLGGVSAQLARYYPGLFDAVLVIACVSAVVLRDGRWWARLWAWLVIIIVLGAIGAADVLHAMGYALRHRPTQGIVAAAPVVAVLLAFSLLLALLRQSKAHDPVAPATTPPDLPALPAAVSALPVALPAAPVTPAMAEPHGRQAEPAATVPVPTTAVPVEPPTEPVLVPTGSPVTAAAPASPDRVDAGTQEAPRDAGPREDTALVKDAAPEEDTVLGDTVPRKAYPATEPNEVVSAPVPTQEAPALPGEPAPPTVEVPVATVSPAPEAPQGIRYAGSLIRDTPPSPGYWDAEDAGTEQFAGLVYRARDDQGDDVLADGAAVRPVQPELDDDAPPFATAPFAPMPRLNRVRSMPAPPADEDEDE